LNGLDVSGVSFAYGEKQALRYVSFTGHRGGFSALLGPNGAGKSTLFSAVTRLFHHAGGTIKIEGMIWNPTPAGAWRGLAWCFQQAR